jgi:small-conductance mechanosensitive channel|tara:strand:- start:94 stop:645 length:552 start_codon:yes stop_codon:yes gene_type:complete
MNLQDLDYQNILYSPLFSKLIVTVIIILVGLIIGRIIGKVIYRLIKELGITKIVRKTTKTNISIEKIMSNFVTYFIYFVTIIMALNNIGLSTTVLNIIIVAIITIVVIALFFVVKDFFPNIISGIFIKQKNLIKQGDFIRINDKEGKVIKINAIETTLKTKKGDIIYIPNALLSKQEVTKLKQ